MRFNGAWTYENQQLHSGAVVLEFRVEDDYDRKQLSKVKKNLEFWLKGHSVPAGFAASRESARVDL